MFENDLKNGLPREGMTNSKQINYLVESPIFDEIARIGQPARFGSLRWIWAETIYIYS